MFVRTLTRFFADVVDAKLEKRTERAREFLWAHAFGPVEPIVGGRLPPLVLHERPVLAVACGTTAGDVKR